MAQVKRGIRVYSIAENCTSKILLKLVRTGTWNFVHATLQLGDELNAVEDAITIGLIVKEHGAQKPASSNNSNTSYVSNNGNSFGFGASFCGLAHNTNAL